MALIDKIKAQYPHPRALVDEPPIAEGEYCVGGAICLYYCRLKNDDGFPGLHFPDAGILARRLVRLNSDLPIELAMTYARLLTTANDTGNFAEAWHIAQQALEYVAAQDIA